MWGERYKRSGSGCPDMAPLRVMLLLYMHRMIAWGVALLKVPSTRAPALRNDFTPIGRFEPAFDRAGEQKFNQAFVAPAHSPFHKVFASTDALNIELLAR